MRRGIGITLMLVLLAGVLCVPALMASPTEYGFYNIRIPNAALVRTIAVDPKSSLASAPVQTVEMEIDGHTVQLAKNSDCLDVTVSGSTAGAEYMAVLTDTAQAVPTVSSQLFFLDQETAGDTVSFKVFPDLSSVSSPTDMMLYITSDTDDTLTIPLSYYVGLREDANAGTLHNDGLGDVTWTYDEDAGQVTIRGAVSGNAAVLVAGYAGDKTMTSLEAVTASDKSVTVAKSCATVKIFWVDADGAPLCQHAEITPAGS